MLRYGGRGNHQSRKVGNLKNTLQSLCLCGLYLLFKKWKETNNTPKPNKSKKAPNPLVTGVRSSMGNSVIQLY